MRMWRGLANLSLTIIASFVLIMLGILYFMLTIWIIKVGANWSGVGQLDPNWAVLTAGIVTAAALIGSAMQR